MAKYVVIGLIKRTGRRDILTKPLPITMATARKRSLQKELNTSIPKFKWVSRLKVEKVVNT